MSNSSNTLTQKNQENAMSIDMCNFFAKLIPNEFKFKITTMKKPNSHSKYKEFVADTLYKDFSIEFETDFHKTMIISYCYNRKEFFSFCIFNVTISDTSFEELYFDNSNFNTYLESQKYTDSFFAKGVVEIIRKRFGINIFSTTNIPDLFCDIDTLCWLYGAQSVLTEKNKHKCGSFNFARYNEKILSTFIKSLYIQYMENNFLIAPLRFIIIDFII